MFSTSMVPVSYQLHALVQETWKLTCSSKQVGGLQAIPDCAAEARVEAIQLYGDEMRDGAGSKRRMRVVCERCVQFERVKSCQWSMVPRREGRPSEQLRSERGMQGR